MKRLPYIDVLRGIAILTVMLQHLPRPFGNVFGPFQTMGGRGVDLFFVLSGFLIATTALQRAEVPSGVVPPARAYWLLRIARIWPLYFVVLAIFASGAPVIADEVTSVIRAIPWPYLTFTSNYVAQETLELGVFWSLAIEEQFYLAIGLLVVLAGRRRAVLEGAFAGLALCAVAVAVRYRFDLAQLNGGGHLPKSNYTFLLFHSTLARMDQLAIGVLAAVAAPRLNRLPFAQSGRAARTVSWGAVVAALAALAWLPHRAAIAFTVVGLAFAAVVLCLQRPGASSRTPAAWESGLFRTLGGIGRLSFGMYLFHPVVRRWVELGFDASGAPLKGSAWAIAFYAAWLLATWALAAVSQRLLEEPILGRVRARVRDLPVAPVAAAAPVANAA